MKTVTCVTGAVTKGNKWALDFSRGVQHQDLGICGGFCVGIGASFWMVGSVR